MACATGRFVVRGCLAAVCLLAAFRATPAFGDDANVLAPSGTVKVAAIQAASKVGLISYNRKLLASLIIKAAKNGAKIVVTPECALQGYMDVGGEVTWAKDAVSADNELPVEKGAASLKDPSIRYFQGLAKKRKIYICLGFVEKALEPSGKRGHSAASKASNDPNPKTPVHVWKYYNAQILIAPSGKIIAHHRKRNLWPPGDGGWASPGNLDVQVVDTEYGRLGLMICFDLHVLPPLLAKKHADIVLYSVGWFGPNEENWFHNVFPRDYVKPYGFNVVLANWSADDVAEPWPGAGYSAVYDGSGKILAKAKGVKGSEIVYANIKLRPPSPKGKREFTTANPNSSRRKKAATPAAKAEFSQGPRGKVRIHMNKVLSRKSRRALLGTNIAAWYSRYFNSKFPDALVDSWRPGFIRMPGGSWSDALYWNGNGATRFDKVTGMWSVDYSKFAPGFLLDSKNKKNPRGKARSVDVRILHDFIKRHSSYTEPLVTVNFGTGDAKMASEWVRWANKKQGYDVKYWQVGNEMDGAWEAGHFIWGGKGEVDAKYYAKKYKRYAVAMKRVDGSIKVGAQIPVGWVEALLKEAAPYVDFIDHHYYFKDRKRVNDGIRGMFVDLGRVVEDVAHDRQLIAKYAPRRKIELGVTEWNLHVLGPRTATVVSGLLACYAVGVMKSIDLDFATQWDMFTCNAKTGGVGHGLAIFDKRECLVKPQGFAFQMWGRLMHDTMVAADVAGSDKLYAFATTKSGVGLSLMFINIEPRHPVAVSVDFGNFHAASRGRETLMSEGCTLWDPNSRKYLWSNKPPVVGYPKIPSGADFTTLVPPYSVKVVEIPVARSALASRVASEAGKWHPGRPRKLELIVPSETPPLSAIKCFLALRDSSGNIAYPVSGMGAGKVSVKGVASVDDPVVSLGGGVGRFNLVPRKGASGQVKVTAEFNGLTTSKTLSVRGAMYSDITLLKFDAKRDAGRAKAHAANCKVGLDFSVRPNEGVLSVGLTGVKLPKKKNYLFVIPFKKGVRVPEKLVGVYFDAKLSADCPKDSLQLYVRLGKAEFGPFTIRKIPGGKFDAIRAVETDVGKLEKSFKANSCIFVLKKHANLKGHLYIDNFGVVEYK